MRTRFVAVTTAVLFGCTFFACGADSSGDGGDDSSGGAGPNGSSSGSDGIGGKDDTHTSDPLPFAFRYGINLGHRNGAWGDDKEATLASRSGARSIRVKLSASHFKAWGYEIEKDDLQTYASLGMKDHIGFLSGSETVAQTNAPAGSAEWQNEYYIPKNLYEPIFDASGEVNPNNYWATYIYKTVAIYKSWIKVWHIWNEPDWVSDWRIVDEWKSRPPKKEDLPRFNGSIFDYVRMLRVAREAARKADPEAMIATGGIGYPPFLDAVLRYTDNPDGGTITSAYPSTGAAYVDVVDFHYYPIFSPKSSDVSVDDFVASKKALAAVLDARGKKVRGWNVSENGAPLAKTKDYPAIGTPEYARNYLLKMMTTAQANGIGGVDWFILSNGAADDDDVFARMGLYNDVGSLKSIDEASQTEIGKAYKTLVEHFEGAGYDDAATKALAFPQSARGLAFSKNGKRRIAAWATTQGNAEAASANVEIATTSGFDVYAWDGAKSDAASKNGKASLALTGAPLLLVER